MKRKFRIINFYGLAIIISLKNGINYLMIEYLVIFIEWRKAIGSEREIKKLVVNSIALKRTKPVKDIFISMSI